MNTQKRKIPISFMNVICCLTVMFIHVNSEAVTSADKSSAMFGCSYILWQAAQFVVPGFIFLSGMKQFLHVGDDFDYKQFYKKRLKGVVLPYLLWVVIYYIYDCVTHVEVFNLHTLLYYMYSGDYVGHFYFVIIILQFYLLMPLWVQMIKRVSPVVMIPLSLMITLFLSNNLVNIVDIFIPGYYYRFADRTFTTYLFYWVAGAYIGRYYEKAHWIMVEHKRLIYTAFIVTAVLLYGISYYNSVHELGHLWVDELRGCYQVAAVFALFALSFGSCNRICSNTLVRYIDASSYNIYLCHCLIIKEVNRYFANSGIENLGARYIIRFIIVYAVAIFACSAYTFVKGLIKTRRRQNSEKRFERRNSNRR